MEGWTGIGKVYTDWKKCLLVGKHRKSTPHECPKSSKLFHSMVLKDWGSGVHLFLFISIGGTIFFMISTLVCIIGARTPNKNSDLGVNSLFLNPDVPRQPLGFSSSLKHRKHVSTGRIDLFLSI